MTTTIVRSISDLRRLTGNWRQEGKKGAIVPTMGALHAGHLSLVQAARAKADEVLVTIFLNPKQFNNLDDLKNYPKTEAADIAKLKEAGVSAVFIPPATEMYPDGFNTTVSVGGLTDGLCGEKRPGHFEGVATVVAKLFLQSGADLAFFGEKDFQQLQIIRKLARDLDIPTEVVGCPTVREEDGLAMSSRNALLSSHERQVAPRLASILSETVEKISAETNLQALLDEARSDILASGFREVEYLELRSEEDLRLVESINSPMRLFVAAWLGQTRLIDNMPVPF